MSHCPNSLMDLVDSLEPDDHATDPDCTDPDCPFRHEED